MQVELRPYQTAAFDAVREHLRNGARSVLVNAPTGSGKTVLASALMEMVMQKGNRANFVVDRLSLINQTSETFDRYGLRHGVIQSNHPRWMPHQPVQVCSVQTLSRRGWPEAHVDVIDEAHVLHLCHKKRIESKETIVIGLTATPFTKGLAKYFDAVVNVTTTRKLIEDGFLSPYRIFSCAEPDMSGVTVMSTGEWDSNQASDKALEVVGDVVAEYTKHGEGRKFICSAVDTAHVEELARQFLAAGVNVATYTYKDREDDRAETVNEFRRSDSAIRGLITVTAASRGFDVPDVSCVIMARPLRKSLAEHIQLFGRGLRISPETGKADCLARGTMVLTDRGEVPIEDITLDHKVWDGDNFVSHSGAVCQGVREVIEYDGLVATPDHEVFTDDGWTRFEDAARGQRRIARTGFGGTPVRLADDLLAHRAGQCERTPGRGAVRALWREALHSLSQLAQAARYGSLSALQCASAGAGAEVAVWPLSGATRQVHQSKFIGVRAIRSAWNRVSLFVRERGGSLGRSQFRRAGSSDATGSHRQLGALRTGESSLGNSSSESEQHQSFWWQAALHRISQSLSWCALRGCHADKNAVNHDAGGNRGALETVFVQAQREVWDVLNAGPLQRFTANGRLVHNCVILDHSGNCARFFQECEGFFDFGANDLDDGKKRDKQKPKKKAEKEPVKCPSCRALHDPRPFCPVCGHEYPAREAVAHVPGTLKELIAGNYQGELTRELWPQIVGYVLERKEGDAARRQALAIYKDMTGAWPRMSFENTEPTEPCAEVRNRIRSQQIRFANRRKAA